MNNPVVNIRMQGDVYVYHCVGASGNYNHVCGQSSDMRKMLDDLYFFAQRESKPVSLHFSVPENLKKLSSPPTNSKTLRNAIKENIEVL